MDIREIIEAIHKAIRVFVEEHWQGFSVTEIESRSTTRRCFAPRIQEYVEMPGKDIIFEVEAEHGTLRLNAKLGFGYDDKLVILQEQWEQRLGR